MKRKKAQKVAVAVAVIIMILIIKVVITERKNRLEKRADTKKIHQRDDIIIIIPTISTKSIDIAARGHRQSLDHLRHPAHHHQIHRCRPSHAKVDRLRSKSTRILRGGDTIVGVKVVVTEKAAMIDLGLETVNVIAIGNEGVEIETGKKKAVNTAVVAVLLVLQAKRCQRRGLMHQKRVKSRCQV